MGIFDDFELPKFDLGDVFNPTPIIHKPDPLKQLLGSRKQQEAIFRKKRECQQKFESYLGGVSPELEEFAHNVNKFGNSIEDFARKTEDNKHNVAEALAMNLSELFIGNQTPEKGDHLYVGRGVYSHHGIYVGNGQVIHYLLKHVSQDSLETFADGSKIRIRTSSESPIRYSRSEVVQRAQSRLYEMSYNLFDNNCEHFARWCRCNEFAHEG